eukprot:scaffold6881_cov71-Phaeocystis_antarctica.AAC.1
MRSAFAAMIKLGGHLLSTYITSHKYHPRQSGLPRGSAMRCALVALALVALATPALSLDVPPALTTPSVAQPSQEQEGRPSLLRRVSAPLATPVRMFREAPPITRSWVSASVVMAMLSQARVIDLRNVCFDERAVWYKACSLSSSGCRSITSGSALRRAAAAAAAAAAACTQHPRDACTVHRDRAAARGGQLLRGTQAAAR